MPNRKFTLFSDGASRGNPGPSSYGFVIQEEQNILYEGSEMIPDTTNNVAEYEGLLQGLKKCLELGAEEVEVRSDSELLIRQLSGIYKIKAPHLKEYWNHLQKIATMFKRVEWKHIPREQNKRADQLANAAFNRCQSPSKLER